jgi:hypothetical protein
MVSMLIYILVLAIIAFVLWYIVGLLPPPIQPPARVAVVVICAISLIYVLLQFAGGMPSLGHRPLRP